MVAASGANLWLQNQTEVCTTSGEAYRLRRFAFADAIPAA
jgi:hypothetical protein